MEEKDPFAEFGGKSLPASADPFAEFGGAELKKKGNGVVSKNTVNQFGNGFLPSPDSRTPTVLTPKGKTQYQDEQKKQQDQLNAAVNAYQGEPVLNTPDQPVIAPYQEQDGNYAQYLYNKVLSGTGSTVSGAIDAAINIGGNLNGAIPTEGILAAYRAKGADKVRNFLKDEIGAEVGKGRERKYNEGIISGGIGGLAESIPAMVGAGVTGGGSMVAQMYDSALQSVNNQPGADKLDEDTKTIYAGTLGLIQGALEKYGLDRVLKGTGVVNAIASKIMQSSTGKKLTGDVLGELIDKNVKGLVNNFAKGGVRAIDAFTTEFGTGAVQEVVGDLSERLLDKTTGEPIFDTANKEGWGDFVDRIGRAGLMEAVGGGVMGGAVGFVSPSRRKAVNEKNDQISLLDQALDNPGISEESKQILVQQRAKLVTELDDDIETEATEQEQMSEEGVKKAQEVITDMDKLEATLADPNIPQEIKDGLEEQQKGLDTQLKEAVDLGKEGRGVLAKAEIDLEALKQVDNKVKKYEASVKRLSEARKAGSISENEFNDMISRFDDVMGDSVPKEPTTNTEENTIAETDGDAVDEIINSNPLSKLRDNLSLETINSYIEDLKSKKVIEVICD